MRTLHVIFIAIGIIALISCSPEKPEAQNAEPKAGKPLNIILLIGDGMGVSQVSATFYFDENTNHFKRFQHIGLINTSSATHKITDSGAAGTAFATGERSYNGVIGMNADGYKLENIAEILAANNYNTGVVSTSSITHATPAAFYSHVPQRSQQDEIARQLTTSEIDFFAGGGYKYFIMRKDSLNLFDDLRNNGFIVDTNELLASEQLQADKKYGFLLAKDHLEAAHEGRADFLPNATKAALNYFSSREEPFFVMIEGSQIDWAGHAKNTPYMLAEMEDFNKTMGLVLDFAKENGNTLVIVTSDHETGGFALSAKDVDDEHADYNTIEPNFATGGHTAALVPVFSYGPQAEKFIGIYDNTVLFDKMKMVGTKK